MFKGRLSNRSVLRIVGKDARTFLHGMFTTNVKQLEPGTAHHGCWLNHQGRVLFDSVIANPTPEQLSTANGGEGPTVKDGEELFYVECDPRIVEELLEHIGDYKIRNKFRLKDVTEDILPLVGSQDACQMADPRLPLADLLSREYVSKANANHVVAEAINTDATSNYLTTLYGQGLGEGADVFLIDKGLPFHGNIDIAGGVSFNKGCYVGQELTHRTHVMLMTRKRVVPLRFDANANIKVGANVSTIGEGAKCVGKIVGAVPENGVGIAMMRLEPFRGVFEAEAKKVDVVLGDDQVKGVASIPDWWEPNVLGKIFAEGA